MQEPFIHKQAGQGVYHPVAKLRITSGARWHPMLRIPSHVQDFQCSDCLREMQHKRSHGLQFTVCLHADLDVDVAVRKKGAPPDKGRVCRGVNAVKCTNEGPPLPPP